MSYSIDQAVEDAVSDDQPGQPYSLTVLNENAKWQQFALFQTMPKIGGASVNPVSHAWIIGGAAAGTKHNPSMSVFNWTVDYSVVVGYIQQMGSEESARSFQTASQRSVSLLQNNLVHVTYRGPFPDGAPGFPTPSKTSDSGTIVAKADDNIPTASLQSSEEVCINIGIAMSKKPAVSVQLEPNLRYTFTPKPKYFILAGSFIEGQVIDTATASTAYEVTFSGVTNRKLRFTDDNKFKSI